ncbi:hypothetical protein N7474_009264 [Penicillium riverlandense]|uniref:uncharacterized protein n=1 Tax=Penicillium riverlandense TaxID=1903569 RepID=UPI002547EC11|nr:uncharacterized protein N7474_009264 [Penicillium riverlandense]KAJ5807995.1 hypothetical protein N7474_009264 [Penicillium riverlandense]
MNGRDRSRGATTAQASNGRNGSADASMSRAEKFEDEKKRIVQSCYSKKDSDGTLVESYITHVRITEDSQYPSAPAPPSSAPDNKKARVIIVSVRRSGRVRMHKARENNDGTFSIGKTWMLDDLSSIQSYNALVPKTPTEAQHKEWASNVGFVVTVGKPYYWHARSSKEKEFFIGSLVKIYKKYTGGKVPNLIGFDDRERQLLAGGAPSAPSAPSARPGSKGGDGSAPPLSKSALVSYDVSRNMSRDVSRELSRDPSRDASRDGSRASSRDGSREVRRKASQDPTLRVQRSRDQVSRPSTSQANSSVSEPTSIPPSTSISGQRDLPPSRGNDVPAPIAPALPTESISKEPTPPATAEEKRPSTSRGEEPIQMPQPSTFQATQAVESTTPGTRHDNLRPSVGPAPGPLPTPTMVQETSSQSRDTSDATDIMSREPAKQATSDPRFSLAQVSDPAVAAAFLAAGSPVEARKRPVELSAGSPTTAATSAAPAPASPPAVTPTVPVPDSPPAATPAEPVQASPPAATPAEPSPASPSTITPSMKSPTLTTPTSATALPETPVDDDPEAHRPGLGPMVKKKSAKDVAGAFRKAANAYGAFKPRPGGAGERLLAAAKKPQEPEAAEPDGITGVVPAPSLTRSGTEPESPVAETTDRELPAPDKDTTPVVEATQPAFDETAAAAAVVAEESRDTFPDNVKFITDDRSRTPSPSGQGRRRRRQDNTLKYCQALGIEIGILDGRAIDFDDILSELGWNGRLSDEKRIEDLEADVRREVGRVEAVSWLGNLEQQDGKVEQLAKLIDKTVEECEELDGLLTLYSHELNTLHDDVAYIEAQGQGLQVQTANQKLLQNELQNLLKTLSISGHELRPLKEASLSNLDGLRDTEGALVILYKAMVMIDSDIGQNKKRLVDSAGDRGGVGVYADTDIGQMRAIKEKKEEYRSAASMFLGRFKQFMTLAFKMAEQKRADALAHASKEPLKLNSSARGHFRREVWMYHPLMLFAREISMAEWHGLIRLYEQQSKPSYQNEFRDNNLAWKKSARKPTPDEQELLFTHQEKEKEVEGITMAARKLTVRRGKTVRAATGLRLSSSDKKRGGKIEPCEAFAGTLRETLNMIAEEQDFAVQFFHLDSLATADFTDLVASTTPDARECPAFSTRHPHDPDRAMSKRVEQIMDEIYSFWPTDMQNLIDWAVQDDPMQGIGILFGLESAMTDLDDTNQEFILHALQKLHSRLMGLFNRFVDEQIRGIEDTKVKINKRKGVISFMRVFPHFSTAIENMLNHPSGEFCDVRISVNDAYDRINRAMWESLKFIAKEAPGQVAGVSAAAGDPEDKEVLNYHILLIENMNHYAEEVLVHNLPVLERWVERAVQDYEEHMKLYLDAVIHRPLGKLLDFLRSVEGLQEANDNADIAARSSHSRAVAKKVLSSYDSKEIRRGIELLKKRVEKHFGDADDPGLSRSLVLKVLRACEGRYEDAYDRTRRIIDSVYDGQLELEWRKDEMQAMFRK